MLDGWLLPWGREKHWVFNQSIMPVDRAPCYFHNPPCLSLHNDVQNITQVGKQPWNQLWCRQGWAQQGPIPGVPNPQADGVWMGVPSEDSQENYGILVPSVTSQGSCHPSPQRAFIPWLLPFSVAVWGGILSKCFLVNWAGCVSWHQAWQLPERTLKASQIYISINYFKNCSPHIFTPVNTN